MAEHDEETLGEAQDTDAPAGEQEWQSNSANWRTRARAEDQFDPQDTRRRGTSIVSEGASINGTFRSEDPVYVEGTFDGEIIASSDVIIARGAAVNASVQAIRLTVAGRLSGVVACTDRFEVLETGDVSAEIFAPVFVVHDGATINGTFKMRLDDPEGDASGDENQTDPIES